VEGGLARMGKRGRNIDLTRTKKVERRIQKR